MLALARVADHRPRGIVELQIAAACVVEGRDGLAVGRGQIVEEGIELRRDRFADRLPALAEVQRAGRRNRHLRRDARVLLEETEVIDMRVTDEIDPVDDPYALRLGGDTGELDAVAGGIEFDPGKAAIEVEVPP